MREGEAKASRESQEGEERSRVRSSIERGEHGRSEANRERPPYGEARSSGARGAGELLSCLAGSSSSESHRGSSSRGEQSEGSGEGSRFSSGGSQSDAIAVGGGTESEGYRACEQSEGRSESANRAEHETESERGGDCSPHARDNRRYRGGGQSLPLLLKYFVTIRAQRSEEESSSRSERKASIVGDGSHLASSSRRRGRPEEARPSSSARSRSRARK